MAVMTSREFNQHTSEAKRTADKEPVFITDRGRTAHVLMSIEAYQKLGGHGRNLAERLSMPEDDRIEFDPPKLENFGFKPAEFD
jgi:prevent-host-death family protein